VDRDGWLTLLGLDQDEVPRLLVLESTWWRQRALDARLPLLESVRELGLPDLWHGWYRDLPVVFGLAYGAPRAVEQLHVLGACGTPVAVQIGPCSSLQPGVHTGDVVLAEQATIDEGASQYYGAQGASSANLGRVARAARLFADRGHHTHRGSTVTTSALLVAPPQLLAQWAAAGHLAVDTETSAVFSAASGQGMRAVSLRFVRDELPGRPWTTRPTSEEQRRQERASKTVFEVALGMA
jgi:uridine phosphorylase